ncbi:Neuropeptides capa receptor [Eumeta japonica]|uniref:Neuropeptides capa receptor n=1 Tax=Eumeta variegata TaxID=151549 RepID=A0A4C1S7C8_EUMVA|nr:Neuropeptides capa receptor [Eumeta japonica]
MNNMEENTGMALWKTFLDNTMKRDMHTVDIIIGVSLPIIFVVSLIVNTVTCIVILSDKTMHTITNYYLLNLAVSDLIATFGIPVELYYHFFSWRTYNRSSSIECKLHYFFVGILWNNSTLTMTALAIERYIAVWHPLAVTSKPIWKRMLKIMTVLWAVAVVEALSEIANVDLVTTENLNTCFTIPTDRARIVNGILALLTFILPTVVMTAVHLMIVSKVNSSKNRSRDVAFNYPNNRRKVNKLIVAITLSFLVCWIPFFSIRVLVFTMDLEQLMKLEEYWGILSNATIVNSWISTAINPILFSLMSTKFREALKVR